MIMNKYKPLAVLSLAVLLLGACASSDGGGIFGGGSNQNNYEIRGTVDSVDVNSHAIYLTNVSGYNTSMLSGGGNSVRVYYDDRTTVAYQGQNYRPQDLERGDEITVRVDESGNNSLVAESVTVNRDVSSGSGSVYDNGTYGATLRGTVRNIDTSRRTIEIDRGYSTTVMVQYDNTSLPVYYNNQTYRVSDLERGDEVEIRGRDLGNSRYLAQDVTVIRSISAGSTGSSSQYATVRGTVRSIDTARRTIELESASWISGFNSGNSGGSRMTFQYDTNVSVSVSGQMHPVANLESGDVVEVQFRNNNTSMPFADRITLVRDVRR
jgi:predicted RNA-binding protein/membrane-bound inhibitor of C-type lysozyme